MLQVHDSNGFLKIGGVQSIQDDRFNITGSTDVTKRVRFEVDGLTTGTTRTITAPDADIEIQGTHDVISTNWTARNHGAYTVIASGTTTDPGTPSPGHEFTTLVRNGTATIGGTAYATSGSIIRRVYHSGSWTNYVYPHLDGAWTWTAAQTIRINSNSELRIDSQNAANVAFLTLLNSGAGGRQYSINVGGNTSSFPNQFFVYDNTALATRLILDSSGNWGFSVAPTGGNGLIQLASGTTRVNGVAFGTDTFLYRGGTGTLRLDATNPIFSIYNGTTLLESYIAGSIGYFGTTTGHQLSLRTNNTDRIVISSTGQLHMFGGTPVTRPTYGAPTGTATRTTFDTSTVTLVQLAERVKAMIDDNRSRGDYA